MSVAATTAAWAEIMTKALLVDGPAAIARTEVAAMWIDDIGTVRCTPAWARLR